LNCFWREWTESGQLWVQQVSSTPATRLDVITLQEELDRRLQQRQARETGICPVRRELYSQCFGNYWLIACHQIYARHWYETSVCPFLETIVMVGPSF